MGYENVSDVIGANGASNGNINKHTIFKLITNCFANDLYVTNTSFRHNLIMSRLFDQANCYIVIKSTFKSGVLNCKSYPKADFGSD